MIPASSLNLHNRMRISALAFVAILVAACTASEGPHGGRMPKVPVEVPEHWLSSDCKDGRMDFGQRGKCYLYLAAKLPPLDMARRDHFGEKYDPKKFAECAHDYTTKPNTGWNCDVYRLRRNQNPEFWPYPNIPRPNLPEAPNPPTYRNGMSGEEYFKALCEKEAGEFIYRTVEDVEGIFAIRPMQSEESDERVMDKYVTEDPFDYFTMTGGFPRSQMGFPFVGKSEKANRAGYTFFETMSSPKHFLDRTYYDDSFFVEKPKDLPVERFSGYDRADPKTMKREFILAPNSKYGFTWRGIRRLKDIDFGIKGGELIVLDLATNEVLAVRRNFVRSGGSTGTRFHWYTSQSCPELHSRISPRTKQGVDEFIQRVLKPTTQLKQPGVK